MKDSNCAGVAVGFHPVPVAAAAGFDHHRCCSGSRPGWVHLSEHPSGSVPGPYRFAAGYPVAAAVVSFLQALSDTGQCASWVVGATRLPSDSWPTR